MPQQFDSVLFKGVRLTNVYGKIRPDQADEVVRLWLAAAVLPEPEARRRCAEVVYTFHNDRGELIGVNTVYVADFAAAGNLFYFYRTFVRAQDRGVSGLPHAAFALAYDFLKRHNPAGGPAGMAIVTDNLKLTRPGARDAFAAVGFRKFGTDSRGRDIWYQYFDGSQRELPFPRNR